VPVVGLDVRYFRYQFLARQADLVALGQGSTFMEVSSDALASFWVHVPKRPAQSAIADYLDVETARIDALLAAIGATSTAPAATLAGLLLERRQALVTAAVTGHLKIPGVDV
jgi:type I restriction enzyme S subunit